MSVFHWSSYPKLAYGISFLTLLVCVLPSQAFGAQYMGESVCRMCHQKIFLAWKETGHAVTYDKLVGQERNKRVCQRCHVTARGLEGVQCESCHGPGSQYSTLSIMRDREKALENGLREVTPQTCLRCHSGKSPHKLKPFKYTQEELLKLVHAPSPVKTVEPQADSEP